MDRLDLAIQLIREAQREKRYIEAIQTELDKLSIFDPNYRDKHWRIFRKYNRTPNRSLIKHNLEMARRILRDEGM